MVFFLLALFGYMDVLIIGKWIVVDASMSRCAPSILMCQYQLHAGVKLRGIPPDLRSGTCCLRSTSSNNRSGTSHLRSGTFLLGSTTLHSLHLVVGREPHLSFRPFGLELRLFKPQRVQATYC